MIVQVARNGLALATIPPTERPMIEILYFDGCPHYEGLEAHLRSLLLNVGVAASIGLRRVESGPQAQAERFLGSPTIRVNGIDVDPAAESRSDYGLVCRVYHTADGLRGVPPDDWIVAAVQRSR
jgi:hypothetical protein